MGFRIIGKSIVQTQRKGVGMAVEAENIRYINSQSTCILPVET